MCSCGVRLVAEHRIRCGPWPSGATPLDTQVREQDREHRGVVRVAGADEDDQGPATTVDQLVDLRGQPAAGAADAVVNWLVIQADEALKQPLTCQNRRIFVIRSCPLCHW